MIMKKQNNYRKQAFTTIELVVVFALFIILTGFTAPSLLNFRHQTSLSTAVESLINDLKQEQYSAMVEGIDKTISFNNNRYYLNDFAINLEPNLQITDVTFANQQIIFASHSGAIKNFLPGQNTIVVQNLSTNKAKIINFNQLGVVTDIL